MKETVQTQIVTSGADYAGLARTAEILQRGGVALIPTETVYGLAAHPLAPGATQRIYRLKGRDFGKPMQVLVDGAETAKRLAARISPGALRLIHEFWPGPLTAVFPTATGGTIGLRAPAHVTALHLLRLCGGALLATSANSSGMAETTDFQSAIRLFDGLVDIAVDGGQCSFGVASTVVDCTAERLRVLRVGAIASAEIYRVADCR